MLLDYYEKLLQLKCFSFDDAAKIFGDERKAKNVLYTLKKKGLLQSVRRNYYATINLETKEAVAAPFEFASSITENSYISHHSAIEFYGLANQVFSDIYVSTGREFREFEFGGRWYHCMKTQRDFGVSLQKTIRVTDLERTVLDNIKDFDKVGGLEELLRCLEMITVLDEGRLTTYLVKYHNQFLAQKAGCLLSFYPQLINEGGLFV